jgi:hypothetical protein
MLAKLTVLFTFIVTVWGCGKTNNNQDYFSLQLDGKNYEFDSTTALIDTTHMTFNIKFKNSKDGSSGETGVNTSSGSLIGSYQRPQPNNNLYNLSGFLITIDSTVGTIIYYNRFSVTAGPFVFTISNIKNNRVQGSFSGILPNTLTGPTATIQNGRFDIPFQYIHY